MQFTSDRLFFRCTHHLLGLLHLCLCGVHRSRGMLNPVVCSQVTGVLFFKQRNYLELQAFLEEHSAMLPSWDDLADLPHCF